MFFLSLSLFVLVWEERSHAGGDFGAKYWRDKMVYQAQQEGETRRKPKFRTQRSSVCEEHAVCGTEIGHGAEGRRPEGAYWFRFLAQPCLGSYILELWNHQK